MSKHKTHHEKPKATDTPPERFYPEGEFGGSVVPQKPNVTITPKSKPAPLSPLAIVSRSPSPRAAGIHPEATLTITFNRPVVADSVFAKLVDSAGTQVAVDTEIAVDRLAVTFTPSAPLAWHHQYTVTVDAQDEDRAPLHDVWGFTTGHKTP